MNEFKKVAAKKLYKFVTIWLTLSTVFFIVEYLTQWLEVVTLGGQVASSFMIGVFIWFGIKVGVLVAGKDWIRQEPGQVFKPTLSLAEAIVCVAAFTFEGAKVISYWMPGHTLHLTAVHLLFLVVVMPAVALVAENVYVRNVR